MYIRELYIDRYEPVHLVEQTIIDMEVIRGASDEGFNGMYQFLATTVSINGDIALWVSFYMCFIHGYGCGNNWLVMRPMDDREGMEWGGENTSAKEAHKGRDIFTPAAM